MIYVYLSIYSLLDLYRFLYSQRVFENRVLRRIFGPKRVAVRGGWRKLRNEELHNLHSSPSITGLIKSRGRPRRRWVNNIKIREIGWGGIDWIDLAQERDTVMNLLAP
jgi:hypothetical protein